MARGWDVGNDRVCRSSDEVGSHRRGRARLVAILTLISAGRSGQRKGTMRPPSYATPTIGVDHRSAPRGQTIPPAGLGVDLVRRRSDDALTPASIWGIRPRGPQNR